MFGLQAVTSRRRGTVGALAALGLVAMAGCGGDDDAAMTTTAAAPAATVAASGAAGVDKAAEALLPEAVRKKGKLVDGISSPNPPMEFQEPNAADDEFEGFDIDLAEAIADKLGLEVEYSNVDFQQLLPSLATGRVDMMLSGLSDLPERQQVADWVDYFRSGARFFTSTVKAAQLPDAKALCGKTVQVATGTSYVQDVPKYSKQICVGADPMKVLVVGEGQADSKLQLQTGRAIAAVTGPESLGKLMQDEPGKWAPVGDIFADTLYGVAVKKGNKELLGAVEAAMKSLLADGTYGKLLAKWGLGDSAVKEVTINAGT